MTDQTPTPGTDEWRQWVAEQKSSGRRDGPDHDVTPEQVADAWAAYEAQMTEEANQAEQAARVTGDAADAGEPPTTDS